MTFAYLLSSYPALRALARSHSYARRLRKYISGPLSPLSNHQFSRKDTVTLSRCIGTVPELIQPGASRSTERT